MDAKGYPLEVHAWVCQHVTFVDVKPDADVAALKGSLFSQMDGFTPVKGEAIMRLGTRDIEDDALPCTRLPLEPLMIGLKTRRYITIHSDAADIPVLQNGNPGLTGDGKGTVLALTMLDKVNALQSKGRHLDEQAFVALEEVVKKLDVQLERYTREILELDEVKPKKTACDYTDVIAARNKEIARVNTVSDALDKAKAACEAAKAELQVTIVVH